MTSPPCLRYDLGSAVQEKIKRFHDLIETQIHAKDMFFLCFHVSILDQAAVKRGRHNSIRAFIRGLVSGDPGTGFLSGHSRICMHPGIRE